MNITVTEAIKAPIERVFDALSDIAHADERITGITKLDILSEIKSGKGVRWRETRMMFGKEATEEMEITEISPPNSYKVEAASHGMKYVSVFRFRALDPNNTEVTMVFTGTPTSLSGKLMTPLFLLFQGTARKALRKDILDCKAFIER